MLSLSLQVEQKTSFLSPGRELNISAELSSTEDIPVADLLERLFVLSPDFIPSKCFPGSRTEAETGSSLDDLRGRPFDAFPQDRGPEFSELRRRNEEELFFAKGVLFDCDLRTNLGEEELADLLPETPFTFRIGTRFESFRGSEHIVHEFFDSTSPVLDELRPQLNGKLLARLLPARLETVRLGLESYKSRTFGSIFGAVPTVRDKLYVEISRTRIRIVAFGQSPRKFPTLPFSQEHLLEHFDTALRQSGLFSNFLEQIQNKVAS